MDWKCSSVVEHLPIMCKEGLGFNPQQITNSNNKKTAKCGVAGRLISSPSKCQHSEDPGNNKEKAAQEAEAATRDGFGNKTY